MDLQTFQASTMSAALAVVKQELGPTAVILHTRSFTKIAGSVSAARKFSRSPPAATPAAANRSPPPIRRPPRADARQSSSPIPNANSSKAPPARTPPSPEFSRKSPDSKPMVQELVTNSDPQQLPADPGRTFRLLLPAHRESGRPGISHRHDQNPSASNPSRAHSPAPISSAPNSPSKSKNSCPPPARSSAAKLPARTSSP